MATIGGAEVLGKDNKIGSLEIGKRADIITINLDKPHLQPVYNPYSHLVYCAGASDVQDVIINGRVVMKNREVITMDENKILSEAKNFRI
jgi:5-methylthioadenosine/S-adenosylhomocysteine deaminase